MILIKLKKLILEVLVRRQDKKTDIYPGSLDHKQGHSLHACITTSPVLAFGEAAFGPSFRVTVLPQVPLGKRPFSVT